MNISIELQIQKRKIEYKNNENNTKAKGEISMDFTGKNIIVTGGASGIGKAIVTGVVEGGGHAIIVDLNLDAAEKLREELGKDKTSAYKVNLANSAEIREVFGKIVADFKQIHGLINNAGIVSTVPFDEVTQAEWDKVIAINLTGVYTAISAVYPSMKANGYGRIVNVASVAAKRGGGLLGTSAYAASKAGVIGLTKAVAREGAPYGVACNGVCPSLTMTPMTANMGEENQYYIRDHHEAIVSREIWDKAEEIRLKRAKPKLMQTTGNRERYTRQFLADSFDDVLQSVLNTFEDILKADTVKQLEKDISTIESKKQVNRSAD